MYSEGDIFTLVVCLPEDRVQGPLVGILCFAKGHLSMVDICSEGLYTHVVRLKDSLLKPV